MDRGLRTTAKHDYIYPTITPTVSSYATLLAGASAATIPRGPAEYPVSQSRVQDKPADV
jgi:hypothetical protein